MNHYIAVADTRQPYRLIARTAWWMVRVHGDAAAVALSSPDSPWGEVAEQVFGRQPIGSHKGFFAVAGRLYLDADGKVRRGASGNRTKAARRNPRSTAGLGAMRRLAKTLQQFGVTFATRSMPPEKILAMLPREYSRWLT